MEQSNQLDIIWILNVLWRRKWLIIGLVFLALVTSITVVRQLPPEYQASTTIMIEQSKSSNLNEYSMLMAGERLALTYSQIITSRPILEQAIADLNLSLTVEELEEKITVQNISNTQLIKITVTNASPHQVYMIANAIAETFIEYIETLTADNYARTLSDIQQSIDDKQSEITRIIPQIDSQNQEKADLQADVARLETLLTDNRNNYQILQSDAQNLELTITQLNNKIRVVEPAHTDIPTGYQTYTASLMMFFDQDIIAGSSNNSGRISDLILQVYGPMLEREYLLNEVIDRLGLRTTSAALGAKISYAAIPNTQFLQLNASDTDSSQAILIVSTVADVFIDQNLSSLSEPYTVRLTNLESDMSEITTHIDQIQEELNKNNSLIIPIDLYLERLLSELNTKYSDLRELQARHDQYILEAKQSTNSILITEPATLPTAQSKNNLLYVGMTIVVAGTFSVGIAFLLEQIGDKVRSKQDIKTLLDQNPIGLIGHIEKGKNKLILGLNSSPRVAEDFRKLGALLRPAMEDVPLRKLLVTSPSPGEGKSTVAANLAISLAKTGRTVILVDADLHRPQLEYLFSIQGEKGLSEFLSTKRKIVPLVETDYQNLRLLTSGEPPDDATSLLNSPKLGNVLDDLASKARVLIIDCPPILTLADASYLTPLVDGVLLVIEAGKTKRKSVVEAMALLKMTDIPFIGVVLNNVASQPGSYYRYYEKEDQKLNKPHLGETPANSTHQKE
jgi:non-specific protein-tyrosine kinase